MPYYAWEGVDQSGLILRGMGFAQSIDRLDMQLFSRRIALLVARPVRSWAILRSSVTVQRTVFYAQLYRLLDAGIMLPDALHMLSDLADNTQYKAAILHILSSVQAGETLYTALLHSPLHATAFDLQLIKAGEQSGQLISALEGLAKYYEIYKKIKQKLRQVLFVPLISVCFFFGLFLIVLFVVVPQFVSFFQSLGQPMPAITRNLLHLSAFLTSRYACFSVGILAVFSLIIKHVLYRSSLRVAFDNYIISVPTVGTIMQERFIVSWCYSLALLCERGIPLSHALTLVLPTIDNRFFAAQVYLIGQLVNSGHDLSYALMSCNGRLFSPALISILTVAQESGTMPEALHYIARMYADSLYIRLDRLAAVAQPVLLVLLGLGIATLIVAIYGPILTISHVL